MKKLKDFKKNNFDPYGIMGFFKIIIIIIF
jgi:hypothetical protein